MNPLAPSATRAARPSGRRLSSWWLAALTAIAVGASPAGADPPEDAVRLDGIAALAGGKINAESEAIPVLLSDVELEASFLLLRRKESATSSGNHDESLRLEARRVAVIIRLLAHRARQSGDERVAAEGARALKGEMIALAGGPVEMSALLTGHGASEAELDAWVENALLAAFQLRYIKEQVDLPSELTLAERFATGGHPFEGRTFDDVRDEYRRLVFRELAAESLHAWLGEVLDTGTVRILR